MDNIIEPNNLFDFSKVSLGHPVGIQGGGYFTKIEYNNKPLYIQTTKSLTRQGFVKTGKKYYCDLMFDKNSETIINWFENLEEKCHKLIYEKKDAWFQGNLEEHDIETAFNPLIRVYKSGKYYLLRTNIKNTKDDIPAVKIYNEKEISLSMSDITPETEIICILDIQGIKFTTRNFQIEIEIKQVMALDNEPIFDNCLIKSKKPTSTSLTSLTSLTHLEKPILDDAIHTSDACEQESKLEVEQPIQEEPIQEETIQEQPIQEKSTLEEPTSTNTLEEIEPLDLLEPYDPKPEENINLDIDFEDLAEDIEENNDMLKEISNDDFNLDKTDLTMTLKKPNQVYFELYKAARDKAKQAKKNAILAYLEAKNIKKTYMIENMNDSDSDFEAEIDEVSESELEGL